MFRNLHLALALLIFVSLFAVYAAPAQAIDAHFSLPDDPAAALLQSASENQPSDQAAQSQATPTSPATQTSPATGGASAQPAQSSPAQSSPAQSSPDTKDTDRLKGQQQLQQEEHQRILGVMPTFNMTNNRDALPLTPGQKYQLFFKSVRDPWAFGLAGLTAGIGQAHDDPAEYGQGMAGYAKRFGANYTDYFTGNFFGNAVLPSILHEDPRFFRKGTGSFASRSLWAAASTVWCRRDNGSWGPNYSNVSGNLIGAAISNLYYPASERTVSETINRGLTVTAEGAFGSLFIEFWPDIAHHYMKNHAAKAAQKAAQQDAQTVSGQPAPAPAPQPVETPKP
ncbi:MAG TPA: hypothetical protein VHT28_16280 [Silvibacterium sp.]|nr:hypothetical protein [Silvibacterium sp.]